MHLGRAIDFRDAINSYTSQSSDLQEFCLTDEDWENIIMVTSWLKLFRSATVQMSATKTPMLSKALELMQDLEAHLKDTIINLPWNVSTHIRDALVAPHGKLSEYYYKFDESPFYTWSMCMCLSLSFDYLMLTIS